MTSFLQSVSPDVAVLAFVGLLGVIVIAAFGRRLHLTVGNVHAELTPNGGSSVRDAIDRIEATVKKHGERLEALEKTPATATAIVVTPNTEQPG